MFLTANLERKELQMSELPKEERRLLCHGCSVTVRIQITALQHGKTVEVTCPKCHNVNRVAIPVPVPKPKEAKPEPSSLKDNPFGFDPDLFEHFFGGGRKKGL